MRLASAARAVAVTGASDTVPGWSMMAVVRSPARTVDDDLQCLREDGAPHAVRSRVRELLRLRHQRQHRVWIDLRTFVIFPRRAREEGAALGWIPGQGLRLVRLTRRQSHGRGM